MIDFSEIPNIPDRQQRLDAVTVDCYNADEELSGFEVYLTEALRVPFEATWRDPDDEEHRELVTILGVGQVHPRRGILLMVRRENGRERRVPGEQLWAQDESSPNAIVLEDYRSWIDGGPLDADGMW
jgi:Calcium binding